MIVGIAGLGPRGRAIGARLRAVRLRVVGFDEDVSTAASSGFRTVASLERLVGEAEVVLVACDGEAASTMLHSLIGTAGSARAVALCGALEPRRVSELAATASPNGLVVLDAPVDGGEETIQAGRAVVFAGGSQTAFEACKPALEALGTVVPTGDAGSGQIARTTNDLLRWAAVLAVQDAFSLVQASGTDPAPIRDAVLQASGSTRVLQDWGQASFAAAEEDVQAALMLAEETGASMPFLAQLGDLLRRLDPEQMARLFNVGIADLTAHPPASEPRADLGAPTSLPEEPIVTAFDLEPEASFGSPFGTAPSREEEFPLGAAASPEQDPMFGAAPSFEEESPFEVVTSVEDESPFEAAPSVDEESPFGAVPSLDEESPFEAVTSVEEESPFGTAPTAGEQSPFEAVPSLDEASPFEVAGSREAESPFEAAPGLEAESPFESAPRLEAESPFESAPRLEEESPFEAARSGDEESPFGAAPSLEEESPFGASGDEEPAFEIDEESPFEHKPKDAPEPRSPFE